MLQVGGLPRVGWIPLWSAAGARSTAPVPIQPRQRPHPPPSLPVCSCRCCSPAPSSRWCVSSCAGWLPLGQFSVGRGRTLVACLAGCALPPAPSQPIHGRCTPYSHPAPAAPPPLLQVAESSQLDSGTRQLAAEFLVSWRQLSGRVHTPAATRPGRWPLLPCHALERRGGTCWRVKAWAWLWMLEWPWVS